MLLVLPPCKRRKPILSAPPERRLPNHVEYRHAQQPEDALEHDRHRVSELRLYCGPSEFCCYQLHGAEGAGHISHQHDELVLRWPRDVSSFGADAELGLVPLFWGLCKF